MDHCRRGRSGLTLSVLSVAIIVLAGLLSFTAAVRGQTQQDQMIYQLRIYEIFETNKAAFHARFRDHAARIMKTHDFDILAMWESTSAGRTEFVYLLRWPNEKAMTDRWAHFMADPEWAAIKRDSQQRDGAMVGDIQDRVLQQTDYSPRL